MNKVFLSLIFSALILAPVSFAQTPPPAEAPAPAPAASAAPAVETTKPVHHHEHAEHHPEIHKAMIKLRHAKEDLQKAAHDYDGHKAKAIEAIDRALEELHEAIASDTK